MPDNVISKERGTELLDILDKIFCERSGLRLQIIPDYVEVGRARRAGTASRRYRKRPVMYWNAPRWRIPESLTTKNLLRKRQNPVLPEKKKRPVTAGIPDRKTADG